MALLSFQKADFLEWLRDQAETPILEKFASDLFFLTQNTQKSLHFLKLSSTRFSLEKISVEIKTSIPVDYELHPNREKIFFSSNGEYVKGTTVEIDLTKNSAQTWDGELYPSMNIDPQIMVLSKTIQNGKKTFTFIEDIYHLYSREQAHLEVSKEIDLLYSATEYIIQQPNSENHRDTYYINRGISNKIELHGSNFGFRDYILNFNRKEEKIIVLNRRNLSDSFVVSYPQNIPMADILHLNIERTTEHSLFIALRKKNWNRLYRFSVNLTRKVLQIENYELPHYFDSILVDNDRYVMIYMNKNKILGDLFRAQEKNYFSVLDLVRKKNYSWNLRFESASNTEKYAEIIVTDNWETKKLQYYYILDTKVNYIPLDLHKLIVSYIFV